MTRKTYQVVVCKGPECGGRRFADDIAVSFKRQIAQRGAGARVLLDRYCCFGRCQSGPNVLVREAPDPGTAGDLVVPKGTLHNQVGPADVGRILDALLAADVSDGDR
jgi:(2Fe-2S) ferredoxin